VLWNASRAAEKLGALGVNLFFAISGYLICTLLLRESEKTGTISLSKFYIRRFFRIIPPAASYLCVVAICAWIGWIEVAPNEVVTALFAANYFPDRLWFTAHYWSLAVEEHFYLVWPGLLAFLGPFRASITGLILTAACVVYRPWAAEHIEGAFRYQRTDMRIDAFVLPCVLAILLRDSRVHSVLKKWLMPVMIVPLICLTAAGSFIAEAYPHFNTINKLMLAGILPLIVVSPVLHQESALAKFLNWRQLQQLGRISYGVYLWQEIFLSSSTTSRLWLIPLAVAGILVVAWGSNRFMETPLRRFGRRLATRQTEVPVQL
jgi:peptidoglycan/LPS O-acetylase OafA/YrhL